MTINRLLTRTLRASRAPAAAAFTAAALAAVFQVAVPALTGRAVDIATGNAEGSVTRIAWLMVAVMLVMLVGIGK